MSVKQAELMMLFVTFSWSSSYLLMKIALTGVDPFTLMLLRFSIAFLCVLPLLLRTLKFCTKRTVVKSLVLGFLVYSSLFGTIMGLKHTTASTAAFLGTTAVVLVPILEAIWTRKMPPMLTILSIALAFVGLVLFTVKDGLSLDIGALYCLWGAFGYAVYILVVGRMAMKMICSRPVYCNSEPSPYLVPSVLMFLKRRICRKPVCSGVPFWALP